MPLNRLGLTSISKKAAVIVTNRQALASTRPLSAPLAIIRAGGGRGEERGRETNTYAQRASERASECELKYFVLQAFEGDRQTDRHRFEL